MRGRHVAMGPASTARFGDNFSQRTISFENELNGLLVLHQCCQKHIAGKGLAKGYGSGGPRS